jgi:hypothetical protein
MAVWGEPYIDCFLNVALPSLLAEGNLPAFYEIKNSEFVFITSLRDKARLSESESIANLGSQISIRYILFDPSTFSHAHAALVEAHRLAADKAHREGARVIVLCPDMILSAGSLAHVMKIADRGKRAIMVAGLRLTTETATGPLRARLGKRDLSILEPRKLLTFAMDHFHPQTKSFVVNAVGFASHPVLCIWPVDSAGFVIRGFHLHPIMVDFGEISTLERLHNDTIDGAFLGHSVGNWSDIYVEEDSDDILFFTLTPEADRWEGPSQLQYSPKLARSFAYSMDVNPLHRHLFTYPLTLHTTDLNDVWKRKIEESGMEAFKILDLRKVFSTISGDQAAVRRARAKDRVLKTARSFLKATGLWRYVQRARGR